MQINAESSKVSRNLITRLYSLAAGVSCLFWSNEFKWISLRHYHL